MRAPEREFRADEDDNDDADSDDEERRGFAAEGIKAVYRLERDMKGFHHRDTEDTEKAAELGDRNDWLASTFEYIQKRNMN